MKKQKGHTLGRHQFLLLIETKMSLMNRKILSMQSSLVYFHPLILKKMVVLVFVEVLGVEMDEQASKG